MYLQIQVESWELARQLGNILQSWAFRGQADKAWLLTTTLERAAKQYECFDFGHMGYLEGEILQDFRRRAHHYITSPPDYQNKFEWLALLQHYGGPTRLLDFTHSFYVAVFFALESALGTAAVWGVDLPSIDLATEQRIGSKIDSRRRYETNPGYLKYVESAIGQNADSPFVVAVEPERLSERMSIQQGLFLFPSNINESFEHNLREIYRLSPAIFSTDNNSVLKTSEVKGDQLARNWGRPLDGEFKSKVHHINKWRT